jgi:hypothetical protein
MTVAHPIANPIKWLTSSLILFFVSFGLHQFLAFIRADLIRGAPTSSQDRQHYRRSQDAVIRVYDDAGNVIETHEHAGER